MRKLVATPRPVTKLLALAIDSATTVLSLNPPLPAWSLPEILLARKIHCPGCGKILSRIQDLARLHLVPSKHGKLCKTIFTHAASPAI